MSGPNPRYFYRVLPNGTGWYWEIVDAENGVVDRGVALGRAQARADAIDAAITHLHATPEPYRKGSRKWHDISSI